MGPFRIGLACGFEKPDGRAAYPDFDLGLLKNDGRFTLVQLKDRSGAINATEAADLDAVVLLGDGFPRGSVNPNGRLSLIARYGVGYDKVDVAACTENAIALAIAPDGVRRPVAVSVLALLLALTGRMFDKDRLARKGASGFAQKSDYMGVGLVGRTLGLVELGNIGAETIRLAKPFDLETVAYDPFVSAETAKALGVRMVELDELMRISDFISLHCALTEKTRHLIDARRIALMKPSAFIINTARGPIIEQAALTRALSERRIAGAGLDVFDPEPPLPDDPLLKLDNVILAPHALCHTDQCYAGIGASCVTSILSVASGRAPDTLVNRDVLKNSKINDKLAAYANLQH